MRITTSSAETLPRELVKKIKTYLSLLLLLTLCTHSLGLVSYSQTDSQISTKRGITLGELRQLKIDRAMSNESLDRLPEKELRELRLELDYRGLQQARAAFRALQEVDEKGEIPEDAIPKAIRQLDSLRLRSVTLLTTRVASIPVGKDLALGQLLPPTAGLNPDNTGWTNLGPTNVGGRTRAIVIHPTIHRRMWVGSAGGGIWRSDDGGDTYTAVNDLMANLAISCIVADPSNPDTLYAGTGEGVYNVDALRGAGIFMTTDGTVWRQLPATINSDFH